jgi:hypothetical protein
MSGRKIQIALIILAVLGLSTGFILYRNLKSEKNTVERQAEQLLDRKGQFNSQTTEAQVAELKEAVLFLAQEVGEVKTTEHESVENTSNSFSRVSSPSLSGTINTGSADLLIRIKSLEDKVKSLEQKVSISPSASPTSATSTKLPVQYIPLGIDAQTNDQNGTTLDTYEISLDPAEFPGYTSMQLEVVMKLSEANGTLSANLYDYTDNAVIQYSDVSTTSINYSTKISSTFKLPATRRNYRVWAKSSAGFLGYIHSARLKVNY